VGSEPRFGDQVADFDLEEGHSRWLTTLLLPEVAPIALVQAEGHNKEPAGAVLQRTLVEFNGKMVPPNRKGTIMS
jgi:hypothetical protein